jgi:hypothetical protein
MRITVRKGCSLDALVAGLLETFACICVSDVSHAMLLNRLFHQAVLRAHGLLFHSGVVEYGYMRVHLLQSRCQVFHRMMWAEARLCYVATFVCILWVDQNRFG